MLYSRTLLFIHCLYNSRHLLTQDSHSIPPHLPSASVPILLTPRLGGGWISRGGTEAYYPVDVLVAHPTSTPLCLPYLQDLNSAQPPSLTLHAQSLQSCPTLCHSMDHSPPDSSVHEILQARTLEWVAVPSSRGSSHPRDRTPMSYVSCIGKRVLYH